MEVSGERRSWATSTTSSSPSGAESRSVKCCDQSASSRWLTCSIAPRRRRSCPESGGDGSDCARSRKVPRISPSNRRASAVRGTSAGSAAAPRRCCRTAVESWARWVLTSSAPEAYSIARSHCACVARTASRRASQRAGPMATGCGPSGSQSLGVGYPGATRRRSPLVGLEIAVSAVTRSIRQSRLDGTRACPSTGTAWSDRCSPVALPSTCCPRRG